MKPIQYLAVASGVFSVSLGSCVSLQAAAFVPIEWQQRVKSGAFENQRKHLAWNRDLNANFVDDAIEAMPPEEKITVIVEMNACLPPAEIINRLGPFGTVRRIGTLVSYVFLENVRAGDAELIAADSAVAGVEEDEMLYAFNDISTRTVRARSSLTHTPETFADQTPANGSGVNIAIVDSGVDDAVHAAFAGKFVSGYDATTATPGNPDDDLGWVTTGHNGILESVAGPDDVTIAPLGGGTPDPNPYGCLVVAIAPGANGVLDTVPALGSDDSIVFGLFIRPGPDGICQTARSGDDVQRIPVGQGKIDGPGIWLGPNQVVDTTLGGDDQFAGVWHGTHVAGIALGLGVPGSPGRIADDGSLPNDGSGMAPGSGVVDVKVLNTLGCGSTCQIIDGLEWLWMDGHARVVNMSLGSDNSSDGTTVLSKVINTLVENGITVVVASGNSGQNLLGPAASSELAITVAAANDRNTVDRDDDLIALFSTFGPRMDFTGVPPSDVLVGQLKPDIAAPGVGIMSATGNAATGYHPLDGTSMAAPCVAGGAALLLSYNPLIPPGSLKELLKRSAYMTPQHTTFGPSFPAVDPTYNVKWGFGLLDMYQTLQNLNAPIADVTFTACLPGASGDNCGPPLGNCSLTGGMPSWANHTDILLATDPPVQGVPNTITVNVQNRTATPADHVVVCVGVHEFGVGPTHSFYAVGCKTVTINALASASLNFNWTPTANNHQCIVATINYAFDTDFCNNQTQRNTDPVPLNSTAKAIFQVVNPFNETARIVLEPKFGEGNDAIRASLEPTNQFILTPEDCPVLAQMLFTPQPGLPVGTRTTYRVSARAFTASQPDGVELAGVEFNVVTVAGGLARAYSVGRHGTEGLIKLPLNLAGNPTSDPRRVVNEVEAVFEIPVRPSQGTLNPEQVTITSTPGDLVPPYTVSFSEGGDVGKELTIHFSEPLPDQHRYRISFERFVDADGDALHGDTDIEFRVLQGDANGSGAVTGTDVSFVRGRINLAAAFGDPGRGDVNMTGAITGTDISFVRARIGHSSP